MLSSSPSMNTSKIHLHVEQLSLKTNWRLAERLFYSHNYKERSTQSQVGREEKERLGWYLCLLKGTHKRQGITWAWRSSLGSEGFDPHWALQSWGLTLGRQVLLAGLKASGTTSRAVRNLDYTCEGCTHGCLLPRTRGRKQNETAWGSGWFPTTPISHLVPWPMLSTCSSTVSPSAAPH